MPPINIAPLIEVAGFGLGVLLAAILAFGTHGNRQANRWLAAYALVLALLSFGDLLEDTRWLLLWPHAAHLTDWLIFLVGPLLWMYVRRLTMNARPSARRWLLHAVPSLLCLAALVPFYVLSATAKQAIIATELADRSDGRDPVLLSAAVQSLAYLAASGWSLLRFPRQLRERFSSLEHRTFRWLGWILAINCTMWLMWVSNILFQMSWARWLDATAVPLGLYVLAFLAVRQPAVFVGRAEFVSLREPITASNGLPAVAAPHPSVERDATPEVARYRRSGLDGSSAPALLTRLDQLMQTEKPWLENDLTLRQLAERLGITSHHLSQLLNEHVGESFFDYINRRRVAEVQRCLADPSYRGETVLAIATAAGFNSKASFNVVFRQRTGQTPSQYRRSVSGG